MGRPPCCDKARIKKGPWTPEEDIILVSYLKEHGPGNWRLVPINSGLMRCSKSCRLRWTNYLRPGIKRGNFDPHEEGIIIQLQALLGNRWAAIASYLPQRTDNDIKNYWNTHLKKKMKHQAAMSSHITFSDSAGTTSHEIALGDHCTDEIRNSGTSNSHILTHSSSTYASSAENISRLLEGWLRSSPNHTLNDDNLQHQIKKESININNSCIMNQLNIDVEINSQLPLVDSVIAWDIAATDSISEVHKQFKFMAYDRHKLREQSQQPPICMLEKWLLTENTEQMDALLEHSAADCCSETMF